MKDTRMEAEKEGNAAHTSYNKTEVAEIAVGLNKYLRTVEFVNGVATTTVPVEEAGLTVTVNATANAKTDGTAPTVKVVAAEANELGLSTNDLLVVDEFGNTADYDFAGIATVTVDGGTFSGVLDAENKVQIK